MDQKADDIFFGTLLTAMALYLTYFCAVSASECVMYPDTFAVFGFFGVISMLALTPYMIISAPLIMVLYLIGYNVLDVYVGLFSKALSSSYLQSDVCQCVFDFYWRVNATG